VIQPDDNDETSWAQSALARGYEDGYKKRPQSAHFLTEVPPLVRDAYIYGHAGGAEQRAKVDAFKRTHGARPRI